MSGTRDDMAPLRLLLVCDDDGTLLSVLEPIVGAQVTIMVARTARALRERASWRPDAVVFDIPAERGAAFEAFQVLDALRANSDRTPVLVLCWGPPPSAIADGALVLTKPFSLEELTTAARQLLASVP